jgi:hypothetical protein
MYIVYFFYLNFKHLKHPCNEYTVIILIQYYLNIIYIYIYYTNKQLYTLQEIGKTAEKQKHISVKIYTKNVI